MKEEGGEYMKKEVVLIRLLSKIDCERTIVEKILRNDVDWGSFLEECVKNRVTNLVLFNLRKYQLLDYVPIYIYNMLVSYWNGFTEKANSYYNYIEVIANIMNNSNIPYAFIKGFDLVDKIYHNNSCYIREFNDLDILVSEKDLSRVETLFLNQGFIFGDYDLKFDEVIPASRYDIIRMKMDSHQIYTLVKKIKYSQDGIFVGPLFIDINFTIFEGGRKIPAIDTERLLATTELRTSFTGTNYKSLNIYYSFIQLSYHLFRDAHTELFKRQNTEISLQKFCDIYEYLIWAKEKWNVKTLKNIVCEANLEESMWFVLYLTDILYETTFVQWIFEEKIEYLEKYKDYLVSFRERFQIE